MRTARASGTPSPISDAARRPTASRNTGSSVVLMLAETSVDAGPVARHDCLQRLAVPVDMPDEPDDAGQQQVLQLAVEPQLHRAGHDAVERVDGAVELDQAEAVARRRIGRGDGRRVRARLVDEARHAPSSRRG